MPRAVHLSPEERRAITEAVAAAEAATTGEIVCILTQEVSEYREVPLLWASAAALLAPFAAVFAGLDPTLPASGWQAAGAAHASPMATVAGYALVQAAVFLLGFIVASVPPLRRFLTPAGIKAHRVKKAATIQYLATGMARAADRTGVVIFASFRDRRVEVVADDAIHAAVGDPVWDEAVAAVKDGMVRGAAGEGFVRAVQVCGAALAQHYPSRGGPSPNQFSNEPVEL